MKRAFGIDVPQTLDDLCSANRMALLIYDMQVGITRQLNDADAFAGDAMITNTAEFCRLVGESTRR